MLSAPNQSNLYCQHDVMVPPGTGLHKYRIQSCQRPKWISTSCDWKLKQNLLTSVSEIREDVQEAPSLGPIPSRHAAGTAMRCQATKLELVLGLLFLERQRCAVSSRNTVGVIPKLLSVVSLEKSAVKFPVVLSCGCLLSPQPWELEQRRKIFRNGHSPTLYLYCFRKEAPAWKWQCLCHCSIVVTRHYDQGNY